MSRPSRNLKLADVAVLKLNDIGQQFTLKAAQNGLRVVVFHRSEDEAVTFMDEKVKNQPFEQHVDRVALAEHVPGKLTPGLRKMLISFEDGSMEFNKCVPSFQEGDVIIDMTPGELNPERVKHLLNNKFRDFENGKTVLVNFISGEISGVLDKALQKFRAYVFTRGMVKNVSGGLAPVNQLSVISSKISSAEGAAKDVVVKGDPAAYFPQFSAATTSAIVTTNATLAGHGAVIDNVCQDMRATKVETGKSGASRTVTDYEGFLKGLTSDMKHDHEVYQSALRKHRVKFDSGTVQYRNHLDKYAENVMNAVLAPDQGDTIKEKIGEAIWIDKTQAGADLRVRLGQRCLELIAEFLEKAGTPIGSSLGEYMNTSAQYIRFPYNRLMLYTADTRADRIKSCINATEVKTLLEKPEKDWFHKGNVVELQIAKFCKAGYRTFDRMLYGEEGGFTSEMFHKSNCYGKELLALYFVLNKLKEAERPIPDATAEREFLDAQLAAFVDLGGGFMAQWNQRYGDGPEIPPDRRSMGTLAVAVVDPANNVNGQQGGAGQGGGGADQGGGGAEQGDGGADDDN